MKKINILLLSIAILLLTPACNKYKTFSQLQDEEEVEIQNYIKENKLNIVTTQPTADNWDNNTYYKSSSGLYYHLIDKGETEGDSVRTNLVVGFRFIEYDLDKEKTIRLKNWEPKDYAEPSSMLYGSTNSISTFGAGLNEAIGLLKYKNAEAYVLVPSNLNTTNYSSGRDKLIPVLYHLRITVIR